MSAAPKKKPINIDAVLIRKLGGWKMIGVQTWLDYDFERRDEFIAAERVQFFSGETKVEAGDAQAALGLGFPRPDPVDLQGHRYNPPENAATWQQQDSYGGEPETDRPPQSSDDRYDVQQLMVQQAVNVLYVRFHQGAWIVGRYTGTSEGEPLYAARGRADSDVYDLSGWRGATILSADLIADAVGLNDDGLFHLNEDALEHFRTYFLEAFLGGGAWQVSATQIRESLALNPHLELVV